MTRPLTRDERLEMCHIMHKPDTTGFGGTRCGLPPSGAHDIAKSAAEWYRALDDRGCEDCIRLGRRAWV
jgi:hypothetical protein